MTEEFTVKQILSNHRGDVIGWIDYCDIRYKFSISCENDNTFSRVLNTDFSDGFLSNDEMKTKKLRPMGTVDREMQDLYNNGWFFVKVNPLIISKVKSAIIYAKVAGTLET